ncbi:aminotransferase class III-fold pyridoxal phosphate-dependent enzyme, partial [Achromobacter ruhlandii]
LCRRGPRHRGHAARGAGWGAGEQGVQREHRLARGRAQGGGLRRRRPQARGDHQHVGDSRGRGLFMGVELVRDRASKATFDPVLSLHARIKREAMARGLMVYPMGGTIDGRQGDHVLLAPPFIITDDELDQLTERLAGAIDAAIADSGR